ncbi:excalibur calcium-binding domain-containing protein [Streptomyces albipurpureus]|uniref:Excalibur calcium-binding domain-containing protein n=1 Tax=Streptomyces albipurpureus TaxID=2897419 RepID=A0ABT0UUF8_9ACTN|nr:excalibur calcium-binding domain-containing protein [Streptomyces sp. CWNU-1]MCM2392212.1 excalibur calcium-binding domain-containing protein [Streptomyces sp. CWNU-1]
MTDTAVAIAMINVTWTHSRLSIRKRDAPGEGADRAAMRGQHRGDPGHGAHPDRDGDCVACG